MEIKINSEIRNFTESIFLGLSMRQFLCSFLAVSAAVGTYFSLKGYLNAEVLSWLCMLCAVPFAMLGFFHYHGMTAEKFLWVWFRSEVLEPKRYFYSPNNIYYKGLKEQVNKRQLEVAVKND